MKVSIFRVVVVCLVLLVAGCFSDPAVGEDNGDVNGTANANANVSADGGNVECVPETTCSVEQCGVVDDGCGGELDCGACDCPEGVTPGEACGACGLGVVGCDAGESICFSPPEPFDREYAGDCDADFIYVDTQAEPDGDGSSSAPFQSLSEAIDVAVDGQTVLVHAPEDSPVSEEVVLDKAVNLLGGFNANFTYSPELRAFIRSESGADSSRYGMTVVNVDADFVLSGLDIVAGDALESESAPGGSSFGMLVREVNGLRLVDLKVRAGSAASGAKGADGAPGVDGGSGFSATTVLGAFPRRNSSCPDANGGGGGTGGTETQDPEDGYPGESGARGGAAGINGNRTGRDGADGREALAGADGSPGLFGTDASAGTWMPAAESFGVDGEDGEHGHGGGGGGGAFYTDLANPDYIIGPGGGAGGTGGCGGEGGEGGYPGGASIGISVGDSQITIRNSTFEAGTAGDGGAGGLGALGGAGGDGGSGTTNAILRPAGTITMSPVPSGAGGDATDGARGGDGGGGAGGPSFGIFCIRSTVNVLAGLPDVSFVSGEGGTGGGMGDLAGQGGPSEPISQCGFGE